MQVFLVYHLLSSLAARFIFSLYVSTNASLLLHLLPINATRAFASLISHSFAYFFLLLQDIHLDEQTTMRKLACCNRGREISFDLDEQERIITYDGLGTCISNSFRAVKYDNVFSTSVDEDDDKSSCSSSKDDFESFRVPKKEAGIKWDLTDMETMKEKYSKLLLGEDTTGGSNGIGSALALSKAITRLASAIFGEVWKLEPLSEEKKTRWSKEMNLLLSPTNYMIELTPIKQNTENGGVFEVMTPKARADIHVNLPALQKLDSMLIGVLDSMMNTEFWYAEQTEPMNPNKWHFPSPKVPPVGLSESARRSLSTKRNIVYQIFKAAKSINDTVLLDMPLPGIIKETIPKSGKASVGVELYRKLTSARGEEKNCMKCESEALEMANKLESAIFAWREKLSQMEKKTPSRITRKLIKDPASEQEKVEILLIRAENSLQGLKSWNPNLPHTFFDASKIQYGKDVGQAILEAYSRAIRNVAHGIVSRIGEVLEEDALSANESDSYASVGSDAECFSSDARGSSVGNSSTPSSSRGWSVGKEDCPADSSG